MSLLCERCGKPQGATGGLPTPEVCRCTPADVGVPSCTRIPTRERCQACDQVSAIGFWVPNEMWAEVVHPHFRDSVLCVNCFISRADEKLIDWSAEIKFWPVSLAAHLRDVREIEGFWK